MVQACSKLAPVGLVGSVGSTWANLEFLFLEVEILEQNLTHRFYSDKYSAEINFGFNHDHSRIDQNHPEKRGFKKVGKIKVKTNQGHDVEHSDRTSESKKETTTDDTTVTFDETTGKYTFITDDRETF